MAATACHYHPGLVAEHGFQHLGSCAKLGANLGQTIYSAQTKSSTPGPQYLTLSENVFPDNGSQC